MNRRQIGKIRIGKDLLQDDLVGCAVIMSCLQFVPFEAEYRYLYDGVEMLGVSPFFAELEEGSQAPYYGLKVTIKDGKIVEAEPTTDLCNSYIRAD